MTAVQQPVRVRLDCNGAVRGSRLGPPALERGTQRATLRRAHKVPVLRGACCYRTVAYEAACVLAGSLPIHLRVKERIWWYRDTRRIGGDGSQSSEDSSAKARGRLKEEMATLWQVEWEKFNEANWTRRLIPDVREWLKGKCKRTMDHHLALLLTGHGVFNEYRVRIGKAEDAACWGCGFATENAEHVLLACPRWNDERATLEEAMGARVAVHDAMKRTCKSTETWTALKRFARVTMDQTIQRKNEVRRRR